MFIDTNHPAAKHIQPFLDGVQLDNCKSFDTQTSEVTLVILGKGLYDHKTKSFPIMKKAGKLTFKLLRGKYIREPYFTELTTDKCFAGFID